MTKKKAGKRSKTEVKFIRDNHMKMSDQQIADRLGRTVDFVKKIRLEVISTPNADEVNEVLAALRNSYYWEETSALLLGPSEIRYFEQAWLSLNNQFSQHGILTSDEMAIRDLILHEIACNRAMRKKTDMLRDIADLERRIAIEMNVDVDDGRDVGSLTQWNSARSSLIGALGSITDEILDYQKKKDEKLKQLKATRESRLQNAEQSKSNFWVLMREVNTPEMRKEWSKYLAKMRMAGQIVELQWSQPIEFEDGKVDKPFLSPEGELRDAATQD